MNSSSSFLSELEEIKSCISRVETANAWMTLYWFRHHLLVLLLEETGLPDGVCKKQFLARVCNHYRMLTIHFTGLRICNRKSVIIRSWNIVRGKKPWYRYMSSGIRLIFCCRETLPFLDFFSNNTKLVNCNRRHSFSQYNEFNNCLQKESKV